MTDQLRQAAQQALEALEFANVNHWWGALTIEKAITVLRTALEQQAEPVLLECVTCGTVYADGVPPQVPVQERITHITWDERGVRTVNGIPDDSPRRKELSASEILNMMPSAIPAEYDGPLMEFARAIEAKLKEVV